MENRRLSMKAMSQSETLLTEFHLEKNGHKLIVVYNTQPFLAPKNSSKKYALYLAKYVR